jgi:hypothetical protein
MRDDAMNDNDLERKLRAYFASTEVEVPSGLVGRLAHVREAPQRRSWRQRLMDSFAPRSRPLSAALATFVLLVVVGVSVLVAAPWQDEAPGSVGTSPALAFQGESEVREANGIRMALRRPLIVSESGVHVSVEAEHPETNALVGPGSFSAKAEYRTDGGPWQDAGTVDGRLTDGGVNLAWILPVRVAESSALEFRVVQFNTPYRSPATGKVMTPWVWTWE